jgi:hypothetical protein
MSGRKKKQTTADSQRTPRETSSAVDTSSESDEKEAPADTNAELQRARQQLLVMQLEAAELNSKLAAAMSGAISSSSSGSAIIVKIKNISNKINIFIYNTNLYRL